MFLVLVSLMMFIGCDSNPYGFGETLGVCEEPKAMNYGIDGNNFLTNPCKHCKDVKVWTSYMDCEYSKESNDKTYEYEIKYIDDDFFNLDLDSLYISIECHDMNLDSVLVENCCFIEGASNYDWRVIMNWSDVDISITSQDSTYCIFE